MGHWVRVPWHWPFDCPGFFRGFRHPFLDLIDRTGPPAAAPRRPASLLLLLLFLQALPGPAKFGRSRV